MKRILFALALGLVLPGFAQDKLLSIEDAVLRQKNTLAPQRFEQLGWIPGTDQYFYLKDDGETTWLWSGMPGRGQVKQLLSLDELGKLLHVERPLKKFPKITWTSAATIAFAVNNNSYTLDFGTEKILNVQNARGGVMEHCDTASGTGLYGLHAQQQPVHPQREPGCSGDK